MMEATGTPEMTVKFDKTLWNFPEDMGSGQKCGTRLQTLKFVMTINLFVNIRGEAYISDLVKCCGRFT